MGHRTEMIRRLLFGIILTALTAGHARSDQLLDPWLFGDPVGTDAVQTLYNKTIVGAIFDSPTIPLAEAKAFIGSAAGFAAPVAISGDCTIVASGAITCTKINGVSLTLGGALDIANLANANELLYTTSAGHVAGLTTGNNGVLVTSSGGVPSISSTLPNAVQDNITRLGTVTSGTWNGTIISPTYGGAGVNNGAFTATRGGNFSTGGALAIADLTAANQVLYTTSAGNVAGSTTLPPGLTIAYAYPPCTPQGRLTLTTGTPVMIATASAATTIYYSPYVGSCVPIWDGTTWTAVGVAELSNITTNSSTGSAGPAAVTTNSNYDLFVWSNAGTATLTRSAVWTNNTTRANALVRQNGIWLNSGTITNGPAASRGTYVGTVHSNGSSKIDYIFGGAAAGAAAGSLQVWNAYNRVLTATKVTDTGAPYTYTSATIRQANASAGNQVSFVLGLQEDGVFAAYTTRLTTTNDTVTSGTYGIGLDSTTSYEINPALVYNQLGTDITAGLNTNSFSEMVGIGWHTLSANENSDGTHANSFNSDAQANLTVAVRN